MGERRNPIQIIQANPALLLAVLQAVIKAQQQDPVLLTDLLSLLSGGNWRDVVAKHVPALLVVVCELSKQSELSDSLKALVAELLNVD